MTLKTQRNDASVESFLETVEDDRRREDCLVLLDMMRDITGEEPAMWGTSIVGFGSYHYKYASGTEGDWPLVGFSPRKRDVTLYIMSGFAGHEELMKRLGKHKTGKSCLYVKRLEDVDLPVLGQIIEKSVQAVSERYS